MFLALKITLKLGIFLLSFMLSLPVLLYRLVLSFAVSFLLGWKMVEARSSYFLAEDYSSQNSYTSMIIIELKERIELSEARRLVKENLINDPTYSELRSVVVCWFGYLFWKPDNNFNLINHVHSFEDLSSVSLNHENWSNSSIVDELANVILRRRFWRKDRPLWEIVIASKMGTDEKQENSVVIIKYHHILADGYAAYNVFGRLIGQVNLAKDVIYSTTSEDNPKLMKQTERHINGIVSILIKTVQLIKGVRDVWMYFYALENANKSLKIFNSDPNTDDFQVISASDSLQTIRNAKRKHGVDFNSMLVTGITEFYRKILTMNGQQLTMTNVNLGISVLMPNHPGTLSNHVALLNIVLPIGESDPVQRLYLISQQMRKLTQSYIPYTIFYMFTWFGSLPHHCLKLLRRRRFIISSPFVATNLGGPNGSWNCGNIPITGLRVAMNCPFDGPGFKIGLITYNGIVRLSTSVKKEFLPNISEVPMKTVMNECFNEWKMLSS